MLDIPIQTLRDIVLGDIDSWELYKRDKSPIPSSYICIKHNKEIYMTHARSISSLAWALQNYSLTIVCLGIGDKHLVPLGEEGKKELLMRMIK